MNNDKFEFRAWDGKKMVNVGALSFYPTTKVPIACYNFCGVNKAGLMPKKLPNQFGRIWKDLEANGDTLEIIGNTHQMCYTEKR